MKRVIKSATLDQMNDTIIDRLSVPGVKQVKIYKLTSKYANVRLLYSDGHESKTITVRFDNKPDRRDALTAWNPNWSIRDDGAVLGEEGKVVGWFKMTKNKPQIATANYQEDSLVVDYGTRSIKLTESSGSKIADVIKPK